MEKTEFMSYQSSLGGIPGPVSIEQPSYKENKIQLIDNMIGCCTTTYLSWARSRLIMGKESLPYIKNDKVYAYAPSSSRLLGLSNKFS